MIGRILDATVFFSFDSIGYHRHARSFPPNNYADLKGKNVLITGGTSGIGFAAAEALKELGAHLILIGSHAAKGEKAAEKLSAQFIQLDLGNLKEVAKLDLPCIDILINNAGSMPMEKTLTEDGLELIFASQVYAHYILTRRLIDNNKLSAGARVIFVASGGMYTQKLNLSDLNWEKRSYNHYKAYANAKRSQVILTELFAEKYPPILFSSMHPGWVATGAVKQYMPSFYRLMSWHLRTPEQGADTIIWLAATQDHYPNGQFWFDRKETTPHLLQSTHENPEDREKLWNLCEKKYKEVQ